MIKHFVITIVAVKPKLILIKSFHKIQEFETFQFSLLMKMKKLSKTKVIAAGGWLNFNSISRRFEVVTFFFLYFQIIYFWMVYFPQINQISETSLTFYLFSKYILILMFGKWWQTFRNWHFVFTINNEEKNLSNYFSGAKNRFRIKYNGECAISK